jgi:hypothetical protein
MVSMNDRPFREDGVDRKKNTLQGLAGTGRGAWPEVSGDLFANDQAAY